MGEQIRSAKVRSHVIPCLIERGVCRLYVADYAGSIADWESALALEPQREDQLRPWIERARHLESLRHQGTPAPYAVACCERGWAEFQDGNHANAMCWFQHALGACPEHADAWFGRGLTNSAMGSPQHAVADFTRVLSLDAQNASAWTERGKSRWHAGEGRQCLADFDQALALKSDHADALWARAQARSQLGDYQEALADFSLYRESHTQDKHALQERGAILNRLGRFQDALADLNLALRLDDQFALAYRARGYVRWNLKDLAGAQADFRKAMQLHPELSDEMRKELRALTTTSSESSVQTASSTRAEDHARAEHYILALSSAQKVVLKKWTATACALVFWPGLLGWCLDAPLLSGHVDESFLFPGSWPELARCLLPVTCLLGLCLLCLCTTRWLADMEVRSARGHDTVINPLSAGCLVLAVKGIFVFLGISSLYWTVLLNWYLGGKASDNPWTYIGFFMVVFALEYWILSRGLWQLRMR